MKLLKYLQDVKAEVKNVTWPTRSQATIYTVVVIVISLFIAAYLGALDYIFTFILDKFVV